MAPRTPSNEDVQSARQFRKNALKKGGGLFVYSSFVFLLMAMQSISLRLLALLPQSLPPSTNLSLRPMFVSLFALIFAADVF